MSFCNCRSDKTKLQLRYLSLHYDLSKNALLLLDRFHATEPTPRLVCICRRFFVVLEVDALIWDAFSSLHDCG